MTESDLIKAIQEAAARQPENDGWMTAREIADALGWTDRKVNVTLRSLGAEGRLMATRQKRMSIAMDMRPVPVYKIKDE